MPESEKLNRTRRQREAVRSMASTDIGELQASVHVVTGTNRVAAQKMLARLRSYQTELADLDKTILDCVADADYDAEVAELCKHRNTLTDAIAELDCKISDCQMPSTSAQTPVLDERIPEMELTEFDGKPLNFEEFWDDFTTSVDKRTDISTITKFKLLRKCLVGKAAATCKGYRLTTANYEQVKLILEERYGDKETAIALHLDALIRLKPAVSCAVSELIRIRDECEVHIRALMILGFGDDAFGQLFAPIVLSKLPSLVRLEVRKQKKASGDDKWTMKRLRELLSAEIELRTSNEYEFFESRIEGTSQEPSKVADTALFVSSMTPSRPPTRFHTITCAFCGGQHYSSNCDIYLDVASRHSQMGNRCLLCLRPGHWKADCRANRRPCYYCKKRDHHCSLCLKQFGSPSKLVHAATKTDSSSYEPGSFLPVTMCTANSRPSSSDTKGGVALVETAVATVIGKNGRCQARLVLDCGSTKSFISAQLARRIGAELVAYDSNAIGRLGEATRIPKQLARHKFSIVLRDGCHRLVQMNAEERLAPSVTLQPLDPNLIQQHCRTSDLAEVLVKKPTEAEIDILVGLDYYYALVGQHGVRTVDGLVLKDSSLGVLATGYIQQATKQHHPNCTTSAIDNTVSGERHLSALGDISNAYQKRTNQCSTIQEPDSFKSTLRSLTSRLQLQTASDQRYLSNFDCLYHVVVQMYTTGGV